MKGTFPVAETRMGASAGAVAPSFPTASPVTEGSIWEGAPHLRKAGPGPLERQHRLSIRRSSSADWLQAQRA